VNPLRATRAAFVFLTRIPVGGFPYTDDEFRWAPAFFPVVGAVLGVALGGVDVGLQPLGGFAAAVGTLAVSLLATGAFHEDALADTSDALGGGFDREKILAILKDSRVGAFGAAAIGVSLLARTALIARLGAGAFLAIPFIGMAARALPVWQIATMTYVSSPASRSPGVTRARVPQAAVATAWVALAAAGLVVTSRMSWERAASALGAMTLVTILSGWRYARRLGGFTGDFLGATEQLCELVGYGALAWGISS
jgi:adenosylcobinamide-GDP ribazoletransferase